MNQALDPFFELYECAVVHEAHDLAADLGAERILLVHQGPGIFRPLLVAQGDSLCLWIELQYHDLDLVSDREVLRRVVHPTPRDIGDVQQPIDATEIDEDAIVRDVLDHAVQDHPFFQHRQGLGLLGGEFLLQNCFARQDHVVSSPVHTDDLELELPTSERFQILDWFDIHQGAGQKGPNSHIHSQATLDPVDDPAVNDVAGLVALLDIRPDHHPLGLLLREQHVSFRILGALQQYLHVVTDIDREISLEIDEFRDRNQTL